MKKILLATLLAAATTAMAEDYRYLTAAYNGVEQSFELATIRKITFEDGNVVVTTTQGSVTLPQSEMEKMFFASAPTAIATLPLQAEGLTVAGSLLRASGEGLLHIYSANGTLVQMMNVQGETTISLNNLPKGIYIVSLGKQTIKLTR